MWEPQTAQALWEQGFVFDVRCFATGEVQMIDLNEFGLAGRTESALFHWIV